MKTCEPCEHCNRPITGQRFGATATGLFHLDCNEIRENVDYPHGRILGCGHTVYMKVHVMNTSVGTSCSSCYVD